MTGATMIARWHDEPCDTRLDSASADRIDEVPPQNSTPAAP